MAEEILKIRTVMSGLVQERAALGDTDPIVVASLFIPRRAPAPPRPRPVKRRLVDLSFSRYGLFGLDGLPNSVAKPASG